jgi:hypothetical protein
MMSVASCSNLVRCAAYLDKLDKTRTVANLKRSPLSMPPGKDRSHSEDQRFRKMQRLPRGSGAEPLAFPER